MIIAVDYDETLKINGALNLPLIRWCAKHQKSGATVILWTSRNNSGIKEALQELQSVGFKPNYVNCNTPEIIRKVGYDPRKIIADIYIDDKATQP